MKITDINKAMSVCFKNKIIVYPDRVNGLWTINRRFKNDKPYVYPKTISIDEVNEAITKTYIAVANKL